MKPRCKRRHTLPDYIPARALVTACTRCHVIIPAPKRRHLAAVPAAAAASAPAAAAAAAAASAPAEPAPAELAPAEPAAAPRPRPMSAREKTIRSDFSDYLDYLEETAEINLNGVLYSRAGQVAAAAGRIRQRDLFARPWHQMRKYASEELLEFFDEFGRMSWTEYRAQFRFERAEATG